MEEEIKEISIEDENYPKLLKEINDAPKVLYYRGSLPRAESRGFAIVGARRCSAYGKQVALEIAGNLTEAGLTIVSGLAPGIDTFAHTAVVERRKKAIAVLGTGIDEESIYPKENIKLARKIIENGGCLISEYSPGTPGSYFTFPRRNRIISGMSLGVLIVEAKEKSGALITAEWARKQKRKVFAIPGSIYSLNSRGCHYLIKNGAKLVENAYDILKELSSLKEINLPQIPRQAVLIGGNSQEENLILNTLKAEALFIDKIIEKTKLPASKVISLLANLEIRDKVRNLGGNIYAVSNR